MGFAMRSPVEEEIYEAPQVVEVRKAHTPRRRTRKRFVVGLAVALLVGTMTGVVAQKTLTAIRPAPELQLEKEMTSGDIALGSASLERKLGFITVTGDAASRATRNLPRVEAVVELRDAQRHTLRVESALIGLPTLAAGDTAPFQVEMPDDSRAVSYRVRFRQMAGASLN